MKRFLISMALLVISATPCLAQTALPNGGSVSATLLSENEVDLYTFSAQAGDSVQIRVTDLDAGLIFVAAELSDPNGTVIATGSSESTALLLCDASTACSISQSGTYTLAVSSSRPTATGNYIVYYTNVNGAQTDGALINGGVVSGFIDPGDIDAFTFDAQAGDSVQIRVADTDSGLLFPVGRLYNPDGTLLLVNSSEDVTRLLCDASTACTLEQSGTYTLVVDDGRIAFSGNYDVYYTNVDGAQTDGELNNGGVVSGAIDLGDIDAYTFAAQAGDSVQIRIADTDSGLLFPAGRLYNPDGTLLLANSSEDVTLLLCDASTACTLEQSGTYTLVVDDNRISFSGNYDVYYTNVDGAQTDGELNNGGFVSGAIDLGDIDAYTFDALAGDSVQIRIADTDAGLLFPVGRLYNPDGTLLINNSGENVAPLNCNDTTACALEQDGTYTLVVDDGRISFTGDYVVHFVKVPGVTVDAPLGSGELIYGTISLGDLDSYEIFAQAGDVIELRVTDTGIGSLVFPVATLYDPDGALIGSTSGEVTANLACGVGGSCTVDQTGNYTLVISDGRFSFQGSYVVERDVPQSACTMSTDSDGDQVADGCDNCLIEPNPNQIDADDDGAGNACDADISQDCVVNFVDLGAMRAVFFEADAVADLNTDGVVNFIDLGILRAAFFAQPGPSGVDFCGT